MVKMRVSAGPFARRPDNSAFKQQRLPAWSPSMTPHTVLPIFYSLSLVCVLLGIWLLITVQNTYQLKVDYTDGSCDECFEMRKYPANATKKCDCTVNFTVPKTFLGDVFFYYGLINFHQNLRRYMKSRDDAQLVGRKKSLKVFSISFSKLSLFFSPNSFFYCQETHWGWIPDPSPSTYCEPFAYAENGLPIAPCGAVANSRFNDSFRLVYHALDGSAVTVPLHRRGITWYTDKNIKFRNPATNTTLQEAFQGTAAPLYWQQPVYDLDLEDLNNNGFINDDLIVWMREAAFPNFRKLYGILNRAHPIFSEGLLAGNYSISIAYNFPIRYFQGRKEVVLSTVSWFGGQNYFLPIAYLVSSGMILVTAIVLTVVCAKVGQNGKNMEE